MTESKARLIVTHKGPIDRHQPGDDVTGLYRAEVVTRLVKEGYLRRSYQETADGEPRTASAETDSASGPQPAAHSPQPSDEGATP